MLSIQPDPHHWSVSGNFHASYAVACFTPLPRLVTVPKIDNQINRLLMLIKLVRNVLGAVIVLLDRVSRPRALQRSPADQQRVQSAMDGLSLYQLRACPFCVKPVVPFIHSGLILSCVISTKTVSIENSFSRVEGKSKCPVFESKITTMCAGCMNRTI